MTGFGTQSSKGVHPLSFLAARKEAVSLIWCRYHKIECSPSIIRWTNQSIFRKEYTDIKYSLYKPFYSLSCTIIPVETITGMSYRVLLKMRIGLIAKSMLWSKSWWSDRQSETSTAQLLNKMMLASHRALSIRQNLENIEILRYYWIHVHVLSYIEIYSNARELKMGS